MENWKKYIFEDYNKTLFETDDLEEMHNFLDEFQGFPNSLMFSNICESTNYITIHFFGYNLMIKK